MTRGKPADQESDTQLPLQLDAFSLVIFDFDGVIADSEIISLSTLKETFTKYGIEMPTQEVRRQFLGKSLAAIETFVAEHGTQRSSSAFAHDWQAELFRRFKRELSPISNVTSFLGVLASLQVPYCIASSGTFERIAVALKAMQMTALFENVFSAEQVEHGKPAPDLFLHAAARVGVAPENCLVIEDSPYGVRAAKAANMYCVGFVGGAHLRGIEDRHGEFLRQQGADLIIPSYESLAPALVTQRTKQ